MLQGQLNPIQIEKTRCNLIVRVF